MKLLALALGALALGVSPSYAQETAAQAFSLPALPYEYSALAPAIGADTMETHHSKHHQAYIDNLNKAVEADTALQGKSLEELLAGVSGHSAAVRNNAGGHWNHSFFWQLLAPASQGGEISPELKSAIDAKFGSVDAFKEEFNKAGLGRFGSGWAWLVVTPDGNLEVTSTANQDNPLMDIAEVKGTPILGNDVWEHAYYLDYKNKRGDYLSKWWDIVNWKQASDNYAAAVK